MNRKETKFEKDLGSELEGDERRIAELLGGLKRAEAPGDFEMRVKSGIARGVPEVSGTGRFFPSLRYAAPAVLLAVAAAYFGLGGAFGPDTNDNLSAASQQTERTEIAETKVPAARNTLEAAAAETEQSAEVIEPENSQVQAAPRPALAAAPKRRVERALPVPVRAVDEPAGGSRDAALKGTNNVLLPRGFDPEPVGSPEPEFEDFQTSISVPVRDVLTLVGIDGEFANGGWTVRSTKADSPAQRSGVRKGDIVLSMGGRPLAQDTVFSGSFQTRSLTVIRDGKPVVIELRAQ